MRFGWWHSVAIGVLAALGLVAAGGDRAAWPQAPHMIRVVISVPPGGAIDTLVRVLGDQIGKNNGPTIIVEPRPGAGGIIAAEAVARAAPDGNTLLISTNGMLINAILRKVSFDPLTSFEPICYLVNSPQLIVVNSASPYRTLPDFLAAARAKPGDLSIASVGPNTTQHIAIERLKRLADVNVTFVPFPGGAPAINALMGQHVTAALQNYIEVSGQLTSGTLRALGSATARRIEPLPDLSTIAEQGFKDFDAEVWFGLSAPAKTPQETIAQLVGWFSRALEAPEVKSKLAVQALYPNPICGSAFTAHIKGQAELFARLIRELNIKGE